MNSKFHVFLEVTNSLNKKLRLVPVLYGSLALSKLVSYPGNLFPFAGIDYKTLKLSVIDGVQFKELSPENFLKVYEKSEQDSYRIEKHLKDDKGKIKFLKKYIADKKSQSTEGRR